MQLTDAATNTWTMMYSLQEINKFDDQKFLEVFGNVVEHYPHCAEYLKDKKPYNNLQQLINNTNEFLSEKIGIPDQETILKLHPDLAGRLYRENRLTHESVEEQKSAGLDELSEQEATELDDLNSEYKEKFGFPFVICARENKAAFILNGLRKRMKNTKAVEISIAIEEVKKISMHRILAKIKEE